MDEWVAGSSANQKPRKWKLPKNCDEFEKKYDHIQDQLEQLCGLDDLVTGILSKNKGQILRVAVTLNALFSIDPGYKLHADQELSLPALKAAINYVEVCSEQAALMAGRKTISAPPNSKLLANA